MSITKHSDCFLSSNSYPHVMPVDLSMYAQITPFAPRSSTDRHRLSPDSPTSSLSSSCSGGSLSSYSSGISTLRKKKQVVFADTKGLNLVSIRIFIAGPSEMETEDTTQSEELVKPRMPVQNLRPKERSGFPKPVADNAIWNSNFVHLDSYRVTERVLSGTVRVFNVMPNKTVFVRITYDSWRSHKDIPCNVREPHLSHQTLIFFEFMEYLPSDLDPKELVEFVVFFCSGDMKRQYVDNNKGKKYQIYVQNVAAESRLAPLEHRLVSPESRLAPSEYRLVSPESRLAPSEYRLVSPESRLAPSEYRLVSPESRLAPSEHRLVSPESRLAPSEYRLVSPESRLAPSEHRLVTAYHRLAQSEAHRLAIKSRAVTPRRRSFVTQSPQRYSAWPESTVLDQQRMKNMTCRAPPNRLVKRSLSLTNVAQVIY